MIKRITILMTFLAYSVSLVHSLVPHHHEDETVAMHGHLSDHNDHNESGGDEHHQDITHFFSEAAHQPSTDFVLHSNLSECQQKSKSFAEPFEHLAYSAKLSETKPPDLFPIHQLGWVDNGYFRISLLRAPPAIA